MAESDNFLFAEEAGAAGADAADDGEVGVMEDGQLHGEPAPDAAEPNRTKPGQMEPIRTCSPLSPCACCTVCLICCSSETSFTDWPQF